LSAFLRLNFFDFAKVRNALPLSQRYLLVASSVLLARDTPNL
jgi:hypothetical protein